MNNNNFIQRSDLEKEILSITDDFYSIDVNIRGKNYFQAVNAIKILLNSKEEEETQLGGKIFEKVFLGVGLEQQHKLKQIGEEFKLETPQIVFPQSYEFSEKSSLIKNITNSLSATENNFEYSWNKGNIMEGIEFYIKSHILNKSNIICSTYNTDYSIPNIFQIKKNRQFKLEDLPESNHGDILLTQKQKAGEVYSILLKLNFEKEKATKIKVNLVGKLV